MTDGPATQWDRAAETFDEAADHGLRDPVVRAAWRRLLRTVLGDQPRRIADLGCGTGSLTGLMAEAGHAVHGVDFSEPMLRVARTKTAALDPPPEFTRADAAAPPLPRSAFDAVVSRHVLWAMPDPAAALANWIDLLRPAGRLIVIEGHWSTGAGLTADACTDLVLTHRDEAQIQPLTDPELWGGPISDERYLLMSRR